MDANRIKRWAKLTDQISNDIKSSVDNAMKSMSSEDRNRFDDIASKVDISGKFDELNAKMAELKEAAKRL